MEYVKTRGMGMPALGFGTWELTGSDCRRAIHASLEIGYRHFDTARAYGNEADIGAVLEGCAVARDQLWLTTKLWRDELDRASISGAVDDSLEQLRTDYLDLVLIHWPSDDVPIEETMYELAAVRDSGRIRHLGVSNFPSGLMLEALGAASITCNQVELHPLIDQDELLSVARAHQISITAYCPLARGGVSDIDLLAEIGERHGKSPAQVTLRWLLDHGDVAAIPKSASPEHAAENFDIFDFALSPLEHAAISRLRGHRRYVDPEWAPQWGP